MKFVVKLVAGFVCEVCSETCCVSCGVAPCLGAMRRFVLWAAEAWTIAWATRPRTRVEYPVAWAQVSAPWALVSWAWSVGLGGWPWILHRGHDQ